MRDFEAALDNARGIGVLAGWQIEAERTAILNREAGRCDCGSPFSWRPGVGAYRAACGALERRNGSIVRRCGRAFQF